MAAVAGIVNTTTVGELIEAEVVCASISYFTTENVLDASGNQRFQLDGKTPMRVDVRHEARMTDKVEMPRAEFARLAALGAVQVPGEAPMPGTGAPQATLFSTPATNEQGERAMVDPAAVMLPGHRGLSEAQRAHLEAQLDEDPQILDGDGDEAEELDVETASVNELAAWIKEDKPNGTDVTDAAAGRPDLAKKLLEAENQATDGKPRQNVEAPLQKLIDESDDEE